MSQPCVLLVDDALEVGLILRRLGKRAGQVVNVCTSAESAWECLRQARPDLALLDVNLPGTSGIDLCRRIRQNSTLADLPVALFSHWDRPGEMTAGLEAGADFLVSKDLLCQPDAWQERLAEMLSGQCPPLAVPRGLGPARLRSLALQFNQALHGTTVRPLEPEILGILFLRALDQAGFSGCHEDVSEGPHRWLLPGDLGLDPDRVATEAAPEAVRLFLMAFARQIWCLLGTIGSAPFRAALEAESPSVSGCTCS